MTFGCTSPTSIGHLDLESATLTQLYLDDWPQHPTSLLTSPHLPGTLVVLSEEPAQIDLFDADATTEPTLTLRTSRTLDRGAEPRGGAISADGSRIAIGAGSSFVDLSSSDLTVLSERSVRYRQRAVDVALRADGWRAEAVENITWEGQSMHIVMRRPDGSVFRTFWMQDGSDYEVYLYAMEWGTRHLYATTGKSASSKVQVFEQRLATDLRIGLDRETYRIGDVAHITLHLDSHSPNRRVSIYAKPTGQDRFLVERGEVDNDGDLRASLELRRTTMLQAEYAGDSSNDPADTSRPAYVVGPVHDWLTGYSRTVGRYAVYPAGKNAVIVGEAPLGHRGDEMCFRVDRRVDGRWRYWAGSARRSTAITRPLPPSPT